MTDDLEMRLTVLIKTEGGIAGKSSFVNENGKLDWIDYEAGWLFHAQPTLVRGIKGFGPLLRSLAKQPSAFIIRGGISAASREKNAICRRYKNPKGSNDVVAEPRNYIIFDCDDVTVPAPLGEGKHIRACAAYIRDNLLPACFIGIACAVTASAKSGLRGPEKARLRMIFALSEHYDDEVLRQYVKDLELVERIGLDPAVLVTNQPVYTYRAPFPDGFADPIAPEDRAFTLDGLLGDRVHLNPFEFRERADKLRGVVATERSATIAASGAADWMAYGASIIGVDGHCREAANSTIGRAILDGVSDQEIEEGIITLFEPFGGLARIDAYGGVDGWLRRTIKDFRRSEVSKIKATEAARSELNKFLKSAAKKG
jgi:hypothetical protein